MRKVVMISMVLVGLNTPAWAETVRVGVNGLVCAFCVVGIEKNFAKVAAVESVQVDLDNKLVTLHTKPTQTLDDTTITKIVTDAGYQVTNIHHVK